MLMKTYAEKLRDPRWQRKRLDVMQRDDFMCQSCGSSKKNLQIHHPYYIPKLSPWDYPDDDLITLCEDCHNEITFRLPKLLRLIKTPNDVMMWTEMARCAGSTEAQPFAMTMEVAFGMRLMEDSITSDDLASAAEVLQPVRDKITKIIERALNV